MTNKDESIAIARAAANRRYYKKNKARVKVARRERYAATEKEQRAEAKLTIDGFLRARLAKAKQRAKGKGLPAPITLQWLLSQYTGKCAMTGVELRLTGDANDPFAPSLDRIDNSKGYTHQNVQITCQIYNMAKNVYTDEALVTMAKGLIKQHDEAQ